jgi:hypothetical protein
VNALFLVKFSPKSRVQFGRGPICSLSHLVGCREGDRYVSHNGRQSFDLAYLKPDARNGVMSAVCIIGSVACIFICTTHLLSYRCTQRSKSSRGVRVRHPQFNLRSHSQDFCEIWYWRSVLKAVGNICVLFVSVRCNLNFIRIAKKTISVLSKTAHCAKKRDL